MMNLKWICLVTVAIWLGDFSSCEGCKELCSQAQLNTSMAYEDWQTAESAYQTAVTNGENQQTLDALDHERMQAQLNHQQAVQDMETICGG